MEEWFWKCVQNNIMTNFILHFNTLYYDFLRGPTYIRNFAIQRSEDIWKDCIFSLFIQGFIHNYAFTIKKDNLLHIKKWEFFWPLFLRNRKTPII